MVFARVLIPAVVLGVIVFVLCSLPFDFIEKNVGISSRGDPFVREAMGALGAVLGAIAGAANAIVKTIEGKQNS